MPSAPIPFTNQQASGLDELAGASPAAMNVVSCEGVLRRRPGLAVYGGATSDAVDANGISGLHITNGGDIYAVGAAGAERPIYLVTGGGSVALGGGASPYGLRGTGRPVFAETELLLVLAGGDAMQKVELLTAASSRLGGSPPYASHVVANASRLLANDVSNGPTVSPGSGRFSSVANGNSSYAGFEQWSAGVGTAGFFSAEAKPDPVLALWENSNEVGVLGVETLQIFQPDPILTYAAVMTREIGIGAAMSVVKYDDMFFWMDQYGRFVFGDGRSHKVISDPIQRTLDTMTTRSDCWGFRFNQEFLDCVVWTFPSEGRSFCFQKGSGWSQWQGWNAAAANWTSFAVTAAAGPPGDVDAVVATSTGQIRQLSLDASDDLGAPVVASVTTGRQNRGTEARKLCQRVRMVFRRGTTADTTGPQGFLLYRDKPGAWSNPIAVDLGASGDTNPVLEFTALGVYRGREWQFQFSGSEQLSLISATEDFEVLDS